MSWEGKKVWLWNFANWLNIIIIIISVAWKNVPLENEKNMCPFHIENKKMCHFFIENEKMCPFFSQEMLPFILKYEM